MPLSEKLSFFDRLLSGARIHRTGTFGALTKIEPGAIIGARVRLGDWSEVGAGSPPGPRVALSRRFSPRLTEERMEP